LATTSPDKRIAPILTLAEKPVCVQRSLLELFDTQAIDQISVCHYSRAHHAVTCYRRFPEGVRKAPSWRGSVRRVVLRDGTVTVGRSFLRIFLWPRNPVSRKRRPREAETSVRIPVTPKEGFQLHPAFPGPAPRGHLGIAYRTNYSVAVRFNRRPAWLPAL
jgi:hypothetical protein